MKCPDCKGKGEYVEDRKGRGEGRMRTAMALVCLLLGCTVSPEPAEVYEPEPVENHCADVPNQLLELSDEEWDVPGGPDLEGFSCDSYRGEGVPAASTICVVYTCQADCTLTFLEESVYAHLYPCD